MQIKASGATKRLSFAFDVKKVEESGSFAGYGSVFGTVDAYADIVKRGAFKKSLREHKAAGTMPKLLWQHRPDEPIGIYTDIKEDDHGLYVEGQLALKTSRGAEAHELLKMGALSGLSIGYMTGKYQFDEDTRIRTLTEVDLWEVSIVTFPANPDAGVNAVKGGQMTERDFERWLTQDAGFTRTQARIVIGQGFKALKTTPGAGLGLDELLADLRAVRQQTA